MKRKFANKVQGTCKDCKKAFLYRHHYIVRPEIWEKAGLGTDYHGGGLLHRECLEKRLGRELNETDLFAWVTGVRVNGNVEMRATREGAKFIIGQIVGPDSPGRRTACVNREGSHGGFAAKP